MGAMRWTLLIFLLVLVMVIGCVPKGTGDDDDDEDDDDDDEAPESGVGSYTVSLNMVPTPIGKGTEISVRTLFGPDGKSVEAESILLSDWIEGLEPFAPDAEKFTYEFVNRIEQSTGETGKTSLPGFGDLSDTAFYENDEGLCIGRLSEGASSFSICEMEDGSVVTHPIDSEFDYKSISWINERTGEQIDHLGQTVALKSTVTVGTGVITAGSYLKTFVQTGGHGAKVFGDMSATEDEFGYDGSLLSEIYTFEGDEIFIEVQITSHDGMIELVPVSGFHLAVLSLGNPVDDPEPLSVADLEADPGRWAGALVSLSDLEMVDVDPGDPTTDWPVYGEKSKDIRVRETGGGTKIGLPVYEGTGIPGSIAPEEPFDVAGVVHFEGGSLSVYPRKIEDINPTDQSLEGYVQVSVIGEEKTSAVNLSTLPAGLQVLELGGDPVSVVSIASVVRAVAITRNPKKFIYKHVAFDGLEAESVVSFDEMKAGVLFQDAQETVDEPDPMVTSHFWKGMNLSETYFLRGVTEVRASRNIEETID
jgi:hypothetical protein